MSEVELSPSGNGNADTGRIQKALDDMSAVGGAVILHPGPYFIDNTLFLRKSVTLKSTFDRSPSDDNSGMAQLIPRIASGPGAEQPLIQLGSVDGSGKPTGNCRLQGLLIEPDSNTVEKQKPTGIQAAGTGHQIVRCKVTFLPRAIRSGSVFLTNGDFECNDLRIDDCRFVENPIGLTIYRNRGVQEFSQLYFIGCSEAAIEFYDNDLVKCSGLTIQGILNRQGFLNAITMKQFNNRFCDVVISNFFIEAYQHAVLVDGDTVGGAYHKLTMSGGRCSTHFSTLDVNSMGAKITASGVTWVGNSGPAVTLRRGNRSDLSLTGTFSFPGPTIG